MASELCGQDLSGFFADYLYDVKELPLAEWFKQAGVTVHWRPFTGQNDKGGKPVTESRFPPNFGARYSKATTGITLTQLFEGEPAQEAGLSAEDTIVAVNGLRVDADKWESMLKRYQAGDRLQIHAFRRDELMQFEVKLSAPENNVCVLVAEETAEAIPLRKAWLLP